jgi:DNA-directed RNA polymerase I subunit RPA2
MQKIHHKIKLQKQMYIFTQYFQILENLGLPHVESYNYFLDEGIKDCLSKLNPLEFELPNGEKLFLQIEDCFISNPEVRAELIDVFNKKIYPTECRQRASTYSGMVTLSLAWTKNGQQQPSVSFDLGEIPAMVKSKNCNLFNADAEQLVKHFEHEREWGGYFVVKGHEKLIRMLLMTRRNYPLSIKRSTWKDRGRHFSEYGIFIRCVQSDQTSTVSLC